MPQREVVQNDLLKAAEKLAREAATLRRDVRILLSYFMDTNEVHDLVTPVPLKYAFERELDFALSVMVTAAHSIQDNDKDITRIRNLLEQEGLKPRRG